MAKITSAMMETILATVGGSANINKCGNCMTRLRLSLNNNGLIDLASLKSIAGVMGVVESDEQLQIILGPGKAQTASDLMNDLIANSSSEAAQPIENQDLSSIASDQKKQMKSKQTSGVQRFFK